MYDVRIRGVEMQKAFGKDCGKGGVTAEFGRRDNTNYMIRGASPSGSEQVRG